ncbi:hypothetical protein WDU94_000320, partial [Cyamophila willieti]
MNIINQINLFNKIMDDSSSMVMLDCQTSEYFPSENGEFLSEDVELYQVECANAECGNDGDDDEESVEFVEVGLDELNDNEEENEVHNDSEDTMDAFETDMNPDPLVEGSSITIPSSLEIFKLELPDKFTPENCTIQNYDNAQAVAIGDYVNKEDTIIQGYDTNSLSFDSEGQTQNEYTINQDYVKPEDSSVQSYNFIVNNNGVQSYVCCLDGDGVSGDPAGDIVYQMDDQTGVLQNYDDSNNVLIVMNEEQSSSEPK